MKSAHLFSSDLSEILFFFSPLHLTGEVENALVENQDCFCL